MSHRKRRETKLELSMLPGPAVPGCRLVSFRFLCDIHSVRSATVRLHPRDPSSTSISLCVCLRPMKSSRILQFQPEVVSALFERTVQFVISCRISIKGLTPARGKLKGKISSRRERGRQTKRVNVGPKWSLSRLP